jgi:hypothetical protein
MTLLGQLKEEYLNDLQSLVTYYKQESCRLTEDGSKDEAVLETIKANIGDIFYKLFIVSYKKSCEYKESEKIGFQKLGETYFDFFNKIPAPWQEKLAKDKEHNMMEEYYIEQIKLETAEKVKELFVKHFDRFCKEA